MLLSQKRYKKGAYSYNIKALIDTFVSKCNKTSATKNKAKIDPNLATYDRENVMTDALGNVFMSKIDAKIEEDKNKQKTSTPTNA